MQNPTKSPSFLSILLMGFAAVFLYQLWQESSPPDNGSDSSSSSANAPIASSAAPSPQEFFRQTQQFEFSTRIKSSTSSGSSSGSSTTPAGDATLDGSGLDETGQARQRLETGDITSVDNNRLIAQLDTLGGKIRRLYIKSNADIQLPANVTTDSQDPIAKEHKALELTQGWGLDFQPHLYWRNNLQDNMGTPHLNQAQFSKIADQTLSQTGIRQVAYALNFRFKEVRLRLTKYYFFFPDELFFRQITALENREKKNFTLEYTDDAGDKKYGNLYFKTFSDLGPAISKKTIINNSNGKFFYYNGELVNRPDAYNSGGLSCLPFHCASPDQDGKYSIYLSAPNTLDFLGSRSRYFFAYNEVLTPQNIALHRPDGFIYRNAIDTENGEAQTSVFLNFALAGKSEPSLRPQQLLLNATSEDFVAWNRGIREWQKTRKDLLLLDQKIYVGPRSNAQHVFANPELMLSALNIKRINENVNQVIYSGLSRFFSSINSFILYLLKFFYQMTGNYGVSILCIALLLKLLTFPLNQMQTKSMQKMSTLKPEIDKLNERYKSKPMEKQKKLMEMYKKHNINPARGCLPLLIQMPIFFSLYTVFSESIELWQSPFILWMTDLSAPDTLFVIPGLNINFNLLPILMAGTQLIQQRYMSAPTNPQQKMLMNIMPLMMIVFFWQIPSGVTLYWTSQNLITGVWHEISSRKNKNKK